MSRSYQFKSDFATPESCCLREFALEHRARVRRVCGELVIVGGAGQVYEYAENRLAVLVSCRSRRKWSAVRRRLLAAGLVPLQAGDFEGVFEFEHWDASQAGLALAVIRAKRIRVVSVARRAQLVGNLARCHSRGGFSADFESAAGGTPLDTISRTEEFSRSEGRADQGTQLSQKDREARMVTPAISLDRNPDRERAENESPV